MTNRTQPISKDRSGKSRTCDHRTKNGRRTRTTDSRATVKRYSRWSRPPSKRRTTHSTSSTINPCAKQTAVCTSYPRTPTSHPRERCTKVKCFSCDGRSGRSCHRSARWRNWRRSLLSASRRRCSMMGAWTGTSKITRRISIRPSTTLAANCKGTPNGPSVEGHNLYDLFHPLLHSIQYVSLIYGLWSSILLVHAFFPSIFEEPVIQPLLLTHTPIVLLFTLWLLLIQDLLQNTLISHPLLLTLPALLHH